MIYIIGMACMTGTLSAQTVVDYSTFEQKVLDYSQTLKQSVAQRTAMQKAMKAAKTAFFPAVDATGSYQYRINKYEMDFGGMAVPMEHDSYSAEVGVSQPIYAGGSIYHNYKASQIQTQMADKSVDLTTDNIIYAAEASYWGTAAQKEMYETMCQYVQIIEQLTKVLQDKYDDGYISKTDLIQMQTRLKEAELQRSSSYQSYQVALQNMNVLMGLEPLAEMDLTDSISTGCTDELEKIHRTYAYVQQNIRYIAFENGLAGHRPDRPAEVLRKRYGDCKGMALLLRTLLKAQGFDARMAYIGTDDIASSPDEVPTLAAINHAFCLLFHQGKRYCLDATYRYLPPEDIPQGIQGRKALVENGDSCLILTLPQQDASASTDSLNYHYRLMTDSNPPTLKGTATRVSTGEYKEYLLSLYHDTPKEKQTDLLNNQINNTTAVQSADGEYCLEADPHEDFFHQPIDTTRRKQDYLLPWRCRIVREVTIDIPQGYAVSYLPADFHIETNQGILSCSYRAGAGYIHFRKVMEIRRKRIPLALIPAWNDALRQWKKACNEQIVIRQSTL